MKRVPGLDVFRSAAILCVLACHLSQNGIAEGPLGLKFRDCLSLYGVQLFFVLSGFLIGSILIRDFSTGELDLAKLGHFWKRRWFRTLPNYYFYLVVSLLLERPWRHGHVELWRYPLFLQNFAWSMPGFFIVSWSLCVEEWFYLLFPLVIAGSALVLPSRRAALLSAIILFLLIPFLLRWHIGAFSNWVNEVKMPVVFQLDAIGLGVALAYIKSYHQGIMTRLASFPALAGALVLVAAVLGLIWRASLERFAGYSGWNIALFFLLLNLSCAALLPWFANLNRLPGPVCYVFTWISILSYSLYLCHESAILFLQIVCFHLGMHPGKAWLVLCWVTGSFLLAWLTYRFLESPFLRMRDSETPVAAAKALSAA